MKSPHSVEYKINAESSCIKLFLSQIAINYGREARATKGDTRKYKKKAHFLFADYSELFFVIKHDRKRKKEGISRYTVRPNLIQGCIAPLSAVWFVTENFGEETGRKSSDI
jgi:hypothetical protein